jgi:hypothetical protein
MYGCEAETLVELLDRECEHFSACSLSSRSPCYPGTCRPRMPAGSLVMKELDTLWAPVGAAPKVPSK